MIPVDTSRAFGSVLASPSPRLTEIDLAKIIDRTVRMAIDAKRQLGFAAITTGCDGQKRTSFFDGSACQVEGEAVCIAERQDGITACLQVPMQGSGIVFQSISFRSVPCSPVSGWYILDDEGYLYRIPTALTTPASPYWPAVVPLSEGTFDLVRAGTWAALMCANPVAPTLNDDGDSEWFVYSIEGSPVATIQRFDAAIGGLMTHLETVPGLTDASGQTTVAAFDGRWAGVYRSVGSPTVITLSQNDVNANALAPGQEYKALIYAATSGTSGIAVSVVKGIKALAGTATAPMIPAPGVQLPVAISTVAHGGTVTSVVIGTTTPLELTTVRPLGANSAGKWNAKGIIQRDADAPNAGSRVVSLTLPSAASGVVTGTVRIAFGYPMAYWASYLNADGNAPWGLVGSATAEEKGARDDYDMALVYPVTLGIEYSPYHLNLAGGDIATPDACEILSTLDSIVTRQDSSANVLALPNGEVAVSRPFSAGGTPIVPQRFDRYRVRPAPDTPLTIALSQATLGVWPIDPNEWTEWKTRQVDPWLLGATSFDLQSGSWSHGKVVPCVVWQSAGAVTHWTLDVNAKTGLLQQPTGGTASVIFDAGGGAQAPDGGVPYITILGADPVMAYGWTFTRDGIESALSPLTETTLLVPGTSTYRITLTVPLGPDGTTKRTVYRFGYDRQDHVNASGNYETPWLSEGLLQGAVYDRMVASVGELGDNVTTEFVDTETTLAYTGQRPPSPFIGPIGGGITLDQPSRVYAVPPLDL